MVVADDWTQARARDQAYWPERAAREGFIHASYRGAVLESARLYFPPGSRRLIVQIDPRLLTEPPRVALTPRGPMPHLHAPVPWGAVIRVEEEEDFARAQATAPDEL